jgi:hypothetical protein
MYGPGDVQIWCRAWMGWHLRPDKLHVLEHLRHAIGDIAMDAASARAARLEGSNCALAAGAIARRAQLAGHPPQSRLAPAGARWVVIWMGQVMLTCWLGVGGEWSAGPDRIHDTRATPHFSLSVLSIDGARRLALSRTGC